MKVVGLLFRNSYWYVVLPSTYSISGKLSLLTVGCTCAFPVAFRVPWRRYKGCLSPCGLGCWRQVTHKQCERSNRSVISETPPVPSSTTTSSSRIAFDHHPLTNLHRTERNLYPSYHRSLYLWQLVDIVPWSNRGSMSWPGSSLPLWARGIGFSLFEKIRNLI